MAKTITPGLVQEIVETNLKPVLGFLNSENREVVLYIPVKKLGLDKQGVKESISLTDFGGPEAKNRTEFVYGAGTKVLYFWFAVLIILLGLFFAHYKLGGKSKLKGTSFYLIFVSIFVAVLGFLTKLTIVGMVKDWNQGIEPSQHLLAMFVPALFTEISNTWFVGSICLFVIGVVLFVFSRKSGLFSFFVL